MMRISTRLMHRLSIFSILLILGVPATMTAAETWQKLQRTLYAGPAVKTRADLRAYTGIEAAERIVGRDRRAAYLDNYRQLDVNYAGAVEFQLRKEQVILCPQTADFLYHTFTPLDTRYRKGTRPALERVVANAVAGCETDREKALALMRFCRDLRKTKPVDWDEYVYGGTEEQLIEKPEILCETLGRLMAALCEVAGIPARIVMHDLGGHIVTEVYIEGHWAYIDPRCGMYFFKSDGSFASLLDLCRAPSIIHRQPDAVKRDVSDQWKWSFRAWKVENMYCNPAEVNGFENYSLADAGRYDYSRVPRKTVLANGLMRINHEYVKTAERALGLLPGLHALRWDHRRLRKTEIAYRNDGFSIYFKKPPMDARELCRRYVDPFKNSNVSTLVWGVGPGSVFCFDTETGEIFGAGLTEKQRALLRPGDLWVHENVMVLIQAGGPLRIAAKRAHELGKKILARLEMNHEYGPAKEDNWLWVAFVGRLNKEHPEYRIGKSVLLDYKYEAVRDFKLAILREAVQRGVDGVSLDFAVYPPFFEKPDPSIMTGFIHTVRAMLDDEGKKSGRHLDLAVRVPARDYEKLGLDWETWMDQGLIDLIFPTHRRFADYFDLRVERFISKGVETGIPVYPTVWQALGFVDTDQRPSDAASGRRRYDKPKTPGMYRAQALMFLRAGADGIQLGMSEDQWRGKPWMDDLADPDKLLYAPKHYMVDPIALRPGTFKLKKVGEVWRDEKIVGLRIGDDPAEAMRAGYTVKATVVVYCRALEESEELALFVNGNGPVSFTGGNAGSGKRREGASVDPNKASQAGLIFKKDWWKRGEHKLAVPADWWQLGDNRIRLLYTISAGSAVRPFTVTWVDLLLDYARPHAGDRPGAGQ